MNERSKLRSNADLILEAAEAIWDENPSILLGLSAMTGGLSEQAVAFILAQICGRIKGLETTVRN